MKNHNGNTFGADCREPGKLARMLKMHNDWRRGVGKYAWNDDPSKNEPPPFTPHEVTMIVNGAIRQLRKDARSSK